MQTLNTYCMIIFCLIIVIFRRPHLSLNMIKSVSQDSKFTFRGNWASWWLLCCLVILWRWRLWSRWRHKWFWIFLARRNSKCRKRWDARRWRSTCIRKDHRRCPVDGIPDLLEPSTLLLNLYWFRSLTSARTFAQANQTDADVTVAQLKLIYCPLTCRDRTRL